MRGGRTVGCGRGGKVNKGQAEVFGVLGGHSVKCSQQDLY